MFPIKLCNWSGGGTALCSNHEEYKTSQRLKVLYVWGNVFTLKVLNTDSNQVSNKIEVTETKLNCWYARNQESTFTEEIDKIEQITKISLQECVGKFSLSGRKS